MPQLFVDLDQVLADFDTGYERAFGRKPSKAVDDVDWEAVRARRYFYEDLPPMPDLQRLWRALAPSKPIVLTGIPYSVPEAADNKRAWVAKHLGDTVEVRCCRSSEKYLHASPGDVLIDDWPRYRKLWEKSGGVWITHVSVDQTCREIRGLRDMGRL